jgi:hypothetical protein
MHFEIEKAPHLTLSACVIFPTMVAKMTQMQKKCNNVYIYTCIAILLASTHVQDYLASALKNTDTSVYLAEM